MPTFRQDEIDVDVLQFRPRIDPITGRSSSPTNGAMWYDTASNSFHGIVNGGVASIGGSSVISSASLNLIGQTSSIGPNTLYVVSASNAGIYVVYADVIITTAGT